MPNINPSLHVSREIAEYMMQNAKHKGPVRVSRGSASDNYHRDLMLGEAELRVTFYNYMRGGVERPDRGALLDIQIDPSKDLPGYHAQEFGLTGLCSQFDVMYDAKPIETHRATPTVSPLPDMQIQKQYAQLLVQVRDALKGAKH